MARKGVRLTIPYGREVWTLYKRNIKRVNPMDMRFSRNIEGKQGWIV